MSEPAEPAVVTGQAEVIDAKATARLDISSQPPTIIVSILSDDLDVDTLALLASARSTATTLGCALTEPQNIILIKYLKQLVSIVEIGLRSAPSLKLSQIELAALRNDFLLREGSRIKNDYMRKLGLWALALLVIASLAYALTHYLGYASSYAFLLLVWAGAMAGAWLSFGMRRVNLTFENLGQLEADMVQPSMRLAFAGMLSIVLALFLKLEIIKFSAGTFQTQNIVTDATVALVFGLICGISEQSLPTAVGTRSAEFMSRTNTKTSTANP